MVEHTPGYPTVYGLWTNKGGVGKTTLTVHLSTMYAKLFPTKKVVVVDVCPQGNISSTLLTSVDLLSNRISKCAWDCLKHAVQQLGIASMLAI